jgi:predicted RNA polymerase sigma factor
MGPASDPRGLLALARVHQLGGGGFYALQAAIVACHATASTPDDTDWPRIVGLYAELTGRVRSPIVELNRAVAVGMAEGSDVALASWTAFCASLRSRAITCSPASGVICCINLAASRKRVPRSKLPRPWRAIRASKT